MDQPLSQVQFTDPYIPGSPAWPDFPPWSDLSAEARRQILDGARVVRMERTEICEFASGIILEGVLAVRHELSDGRGVISTLYRPGALVDLRRGERAPQGILVALAATRFLAIDSATLDRAVEGRSEVASVLVHQLREQSARLRDHAADLVNKTPVERLAAVIFEFARFKPNGRRGRSRKTVRIPVRRMDIAEYLGVKAETVSRVIRQLEQEGIIALPDRDHIEVIDTPTLRQLANGGRPRQSTLRA